MEKTDNLTPRQELRKLKTMPHILSGFADKSKNLQEALNLADVSEACNIRIAELKQQIGIRGFINRIKRTMHNGKD